MDNNPAESSDLLERSIAEVLTLPSDQFGSEISKLGVASGSVEKNRWETYLAQSDVNEFVLRWKNDSLFRFFKISSSYRVWAGMTPVAYLILALMFGMLFFWLMKIIKTIFPSDKDAPMPPMPVHWQAIDDVECDSLVLGRAMSGKTTRILDIKPIEKVDYRDLRAELTELASKSTPRKVEVRILIIFWICAGLDSRILFDATIHRSQQRLDGNFAIRTSLVM
jgi:hypothetical protein